MRRHEIHRRAREVRRAGQDRVGTRLHDRQGLRDRLMHSRRHAGRGIRPRQRRAPQVVCARQQRRLSLVDVVQQTRHRRQPL